MIVLMNIPTDVPAITINTDNLIAWYGIEPAEELLQQKILILLQKLHMTSGCGSIVWIEQQEQKNVTVEHWMTVL